VTELANARLAEWASFYVIVGSSGAALIGMQFVVMTLIANMRVRPPLESLHAFGTPTVVQLTGALLVSAIMSAPWPSLVPVALTVGMCGFGGMAYGAIVIRRARRQTYYKPVWQDWLWYATLPCVLSVILALGAALLRIATQLALFVIAAAALSLLLIGIHNAWDTVTHMVTTPSGEPD
jgi:hypothetical protein